MTEVTRMIVIDDTDDRMVYSDGWKTMRGGDYNDRGVTGRTFGDSLHTTTTSGTYMSFSFKGNHASIIGTLDFQVDSTGAADPDWECNLGGDVFKKAPVPTGVGNRQTLCSFPNLPEGDHIVGLTSKTRGRGILVDYVEYRSVTPVEGEVVWASRQDADLWYSEQWPTLGGISRYTTSKGSSATFRFSGTGVSLYAQYPAELPRANGKATYSVDGGPSTTFTILGGGNTNLYNRRIFGVNKLSKQVHTLVITYASDRDSTPLVISHFIIENGTNARVPSDPLSPAPTTRGEPVTPSSSSKSRIGGIVGGVVGGVLAVLLLLWAAWKFRRHWTRRWFSRHGEDPAIQPSSTNQGRQEHEMSTTPTSLLTNHSNALSSAREPTRHSTTSSEHRPASTISISASVWPYPEPVHTGRYPHNRHTEHRIQRPSTLRISDIVVG